MQARRRTLATVVAAVVLILAIICGGFYLAGFRAHFLTTPSMGTQLPVGSLAITKPVDIADVQVGDTITVDSANGTTHTHNVVERAGDTAITQGVLNGAPDALPATADTLKGKVIFSCPALGWGVRIAGIMAAGWLLMLLASLRIDDELHRRRYRNTGVFLGLAIGIIIVRPLLGAYLLGMNVNGTGEEAYAQAHVVSTGLLPVKVVPLGEGGGEGSAIMSPTGTDSIAIDDAPNEKGDVVFRPVPALTWPWIIALIGLVLSPFAWFYAQYRRALKEEQELADATLEAQSNADTTEFEAVKPNA